MVATNLSPSTSSVLIYIWHLSERTFSHLQYSHMQKVGERKRNVGKGKEGISWKKEKREKEKEERERERGNLNEHSAHTESTLKHTPRATQGRNKKKHSQEEEEKEKRRERFIGSNETCQFSLSFGFVETVMTWHCFCFVCVGKADGKED
jgi:hypothetical protein